MIDWLIYWLIVDKKDKDRSVLDINWRPIYLSNTYIKSLSLKAVAFRVKKVLPSIIHHNESGYVEGRYIGKTIRTTWYYGFYKEWRHKRHLSLSWFWERFRWVEPQEPLYSQKSGGLSFWIWLYKTVFQYFTRTGAHHHHGLLARIFPPAFAVMVCTRIILLAKDSVFGKEIPFLLNFYHPCRTAIY